MKASEKN